MSVVPVVVCLSQAFALRSSVWEGGKGVVLFFVSPNLVSLIKLEVPHKT